VPPNQAEVDGTTILTSPPLQAAAFDTLDLHYWRWFYAGGGPGPDTLRAEVSSDGTAWRLVEEVAARANSWQEARIGLEDILSFSDTLRVRFVASDGGGESIVEAGLDDLDLAGEKFVCDPFMPAPLARPNAVGDSLRASARGWDVLLSWTSPPRDAGHDPATEFRVDRSTRPDGGFSQVASPTSPQWVDTGGAAPSAPGLHCYTVYARNSGGLEAGAP